jgi:hypothetical protein
MAKLNILLILTKQVLASTSGQILEDMKEIFEMTLEMVKVLFIIEMVINTLESGKMIKEKETELTIGRMVLFMLEVLPLTN